MTILLAFIFLQEEISPSKAAGVVLIAVGTFFMIEKKDTGPKQEKGTMPPVPPFLPVRHPFLGKSAFPAWSPIWVRRSAPESYWLWPG